MTHKDVSILLQSLAIYGQNCFSGQSFFLRGGLDAIPEFDGTRFIPDDLQTKAMIRVYV